jgi:predicted nucleotidyltransferase component of viral defense system
MIKKILQQTDELKYLIEEASLITKIPSVLIEKDLWVTYFLDFLFNKSRNSGKYLFKGGTSLSKCYSLINRFSEDLDIAFHPSIIGIEDSDLYKISTKNQNNQFIEHVNLLGFQYLKDDLFQKSLNIQKKT